MAFQVKVDEDLPAAVTRLIRDAGYDATGVVEQGMRGWADSALWAAVQAEGRFLVTGDKGFADTRVHVPGAHAGVLLLRPDEDGIRPLIDLIEMVLSQYTLENLAATVTVATPRGIRIRRATRA